MSISGALDTLAERLASSATVKSVFGEPVTVGEKVVIPVAKVAFGLGRASGKRIESGQEGASLGGGAKAIPSGVVEITSKETRFIPANVNRKLVFAALLGFCAGLWCARQGLGRQEQRKRPEPAA